MIFMSFGLFSVNKFNKVRIACHENVKKKEDNSRNIFKAQLL